MRKGSDHAPEKRNDGSDLPRHDTSQLQHGANDGGDDKDEIQSM